VFRQTLEKKRESDGGGRPQRALFHTKHDSGEGMIQPANSPQPREKMNSQQTRIGKDRKNLKEEDGRRGVLSIRSIKGRGPDRDPDAKKLACLREGKKRRPAYGLLKESGGGGELR